LLGAQLLARVTGDVTSFLAARDHAVLEDSLESLAVLQDAIDTLMRSAARIPNRDEAASLRHGGAQRYEAPRRSA